MTMTTYQADYYVDDDNDGETERRIAVAVFNTSKGEDYAFDRAEKLGRENCVDWSGLTVSARDEAGALEVAVLGGDLFEVGPARTLFFNII